MKKIWTGGAGGGGVVTCLLAGWFQVGSVPNLKNLKSWVVWLTFPLLQMQQGGDPTANGIARSAAD